MLIYLAGPLDGLDYDGTTWYDEFDRLCEGTQFVGFMPGKAYKGAVRSPINMDIANRAIIKEASAVLANLLGPGRALGTIREIEFARNLGKPVIVAGDLSASLASHDLTLVGDLEEAMATLQRWWPTITPRR